MERSASNSSEVRRQRARTGQHAVCGGLEINRVDRDRDSQATAVVPSARRYVVACRPTIFPTGSTTELVQNDDPRLARDALSALVHYGSLSETWSGDLRLLRHVLGLTLPGCLSR